MVLAVFVYGVGFVMLAKGRPATRGIRRGCKGVDPMAFDREPFHDARAGARAVLHRLASSRARAGFALAFGRDHCAYRHAGGRCDRGAIAHEERGERGAALPLHDHPPAALASALLLGLHRAGCFAAPGCRVHAHVRDARRIDVPDVRSGQYNGNAQLAAKATIITTGVVRVHPAAGRVHGVDWVSGRHNRT